MWIIDLESQEDPQLKRQPIHHVHPIHMKQHNMTWKLENDPKKCFKKN